MLCITYRSISTDRGFLYCKKNRRHLFTIVHSMHKDLVVGGLGVVEIPWMCILCSLRHKGEAKWTLETRGQLFLEKLFCYF